MVNSGRIMVHSAFAQGHVMGCRDTSPLGIPKSPSFHSGLDLVASASADSLTAAAAATSASGCGLDEPQPPAAPRSQFRFDDVIFRLGGGDMGRSTGDERQWQEQEEGEDEGPQDKNALAVRVLQEIGSLPGLAGEGNAKKKFHPARRTKMSHLLIPGVWRIDLCAYYEVSF